MIKAAQSIGVGENKYPSDPHVKQTVNKGMRFEVNGGSSCLGRLGRQPCHNATWAFTSTVHRCEGDGLEGVRRHRVAWASAGQEHTLLMKWEWGQGPPGFGVCKGKGGSRKSGRWGSAHGIGRAAADQEQ